MDWTSFILGLLAGAAIAAAASLALRPRRAPDASLSDQFAALDSVVRPLKETLDKFDNRLRDVEKERAAAYAGLSQLVQQLAGAHSQLKTETANLVSALKAPQVRGRWGEIQLRRVVELAGMLDRCDFTEQVSVSAESSRLRPDLIVHMPNGRQVVVDAKVPLKACLDAFEAKDDAARAAALSEHARHLRQHIQRLSSKAYWDQFESTPEFVVAFLPGENFFSAALQHDPELIEYGVDNKVLIATPTTLIALLKAVAYGWRQEQIERNAREISALARELYSRLSTFAAHFDKIRAGLENAVKAYNSAAGSFESRVLVAARRFNELDAAAGAEIPPAAQVESAPRVLRAPRSGGPME
jgi:DNA recombination protein RmuC